MNKFIANLFSGILSMIHVAVIGGFIIIILDYEKNKNSISGFLGGFVRDRDMFYGVLIAAFIGYVIFSGLLSTFVSINENLEEINNILKNGGKKD